MLPNKCSTFAMLPRQQVHRRVFIATGISKQWGIWNNGSANECQMIGIWFQDDPTLWLPCFKRNFMCFFLFDALFYTHQPLCMIECWKKRICQHLYVSLVCHSFSNIRVLKNQKSFTKVAQPSRLTVCFRGLLASINMQQWHRWNFFLWSILTYWVRPFRKKLGITTQLLCHKPLTYVASILPLSMIDAWHTIETYQ